MRERRIGRTKLSVTEIGIGGAAIGGLYRESRFDDAMAMLEAGWQAGARYFDTAPFYGFGLSERRIGDFLRSKRGESFVLSTKVGRLLRPVPEDQVVSHGYVGALPFAIDYDYSYDAIMKSVEMSHARLGLNRIDMLYVHDIGVYTHGPDLTKVHLRQLLDSGLKALEELKSSGAISAYGLGVNEVPICLEVMRRAPIDCILLAGRYTLLDRSAEAELLPLCRQTGTSLVVGGVYNSGIMITGAKPGANFDYGPASDEVLSRVAAMEKIAAGKGYPLAAAAVQFPLRDPAVAAVLLGAAVPEHLERNLELMAIPVDNGDFAAYEPHTIR